MRYSVPSWEIVGLAVMSLPAENLWTVEQAAAYLGLAEDTVRRWSRLGKIPSIKVGGKYRRYEPTAIREWVASNREVSA